MSKGSIREEKGARVGHGGGGGFHLERGRLLCAVLIHAMPIILRYSGTGWSGGTFINPGRERRRVVQNRNKKALWSA